MLLEEENSLSPQELSQAKELLAALGVVETVPSAQMGIAGTVAGCGPGLGVELDEDKLHFYTRQP